MARADWAWAAVNAWVSSSGRSMTRTPGSWAIRGPCPRPPRAEQDGHLLAVGDRELFDDPVGQRVVPADNQVISVLVEAAGDLGHGVI